MRKFSIFLTCVAIVNFFCAALGAIYLGGSALNGKVEARRYFLGWHGKFTEVSERIFDYSRLHFISAFGLLFTSMLVAVFFKPGVEDLKWPRRFIAIFGTIAFVLATLKYDFGFEEFLSPLFVKSH